MQKNTLLTGTPSTAHLTAAARILLPEAVQLIADRTKRQDESLRETKDRVTKRIKYAVNSKRVLEPPNSAGFVVGDLMAWANCTWPGVFDDMPKYVSADISLKMSAEVVAEAEVVPPMSPDPVQCHEHLVQYVERLTKLGAQLAAAEQQLAVDSPDAKKWRERIVQKNKINGSRKKSQK